MKRYAYICIMAALIAVFAATPLCAEIKVQEHMLANGLKVLLVEDHKAPLAVFEIWYRVGAIDETPGTTGISHLLEHMMFKGTAKYGSKALSQTVQKNGGMDNAFTSKDYTAYFQLLPSDRIGLSLDFESDRMRSLVLDPTETVAERNVVMEERRMRYEDDPQSSLYELVLASAYNVHPYGQPVIGWMTDLGNITPELLRAHYEKYYAPNNATIVVAGDINPAALLADIEKAFGHIPPGPPITRLERVEPPQKGQRRVMLNRSDAQLPYLMMAFHAPSLPEPDAYALDVLTEILSGGKSSRIYSDIVRGKKLSHDAYASYSSLMRAPYLYSLGGTAAPGRPVMELEAAMWEQIEKISTEPPTRFEMQKALNRLEADYLMSQDSIYYQAMLLGMSETVLSWQSALDYLDGIRAVTAQDVVRVAGKYLKAENSVVGILMPQTGENNNNSAGDNAGAQKEGM